MPDRSGVRRYTALFVKANGPLDVNDFRIQAPIGLIPFTSLGNYRSQVIRGGYIIYDSYFTLTSQNSLDAVRSIENTDLPPRLYNHHKMRTLGPIKTLQAQPNPARIRLTTLLPLQTPKLSRYLRLFFSSPGSDRSITVCLPGLKAVCNRNVRPGRPAV